MNHRLSITLAAAATIAALNTPEVSAQEKAWTLSDCVNYAIEHNVTIRQREIIKEIVRCSTRHSVSKDSMMRNVRI